MIRLDALRSTVLELERTWSALGGMVERNSPGNPNHDDDGKFASSPGGGGHGKHHARRQRRKARLARLHRGYKKDVAELKARHKGERKELVKDQRAEHRDLRHEHRKERKALPGNLGRERASLVKDQRAERQGLGHEQRKEIRQTERQHARELARHDASPSPDPEHRKAIEAEHAEERVAMSDVHKADRENMVESHRDARKEMVGEHKAARGDLRLQQADERAGQRQSHQEDRKSTRATHAEERQELMGQIREELSDHGFKRKNAARLLGREGESRPLGRHGLLGGLPDIDRRFSSARTHKAGSAESILRHCLRRRGWSAAWRRGDLTGKESLELLQDIREYGRAWLHHEAEALFKAHGESRDHPSDKMVLNGAHRPDGPEDGAHHFEAEPSRALGGAVRSHVGRFFARARQFVRELIVAGAMALGGPEALTDAEMLEADRQVADQVAYLDRFHAEVLARPPVELAPVPINRPIIVAAPPMTSSQFSARAEMYGDSAWGGAQEVRRKGLVRTGSAVEERRVHGRKVDDMCPQCRDAVAQGWVPVGTLPAIGNSECMGNCHCYFEYRNAAGTVLWSGKGRKKLKVKRIPNVPPVPVLPAVPVPVAPAAIIGPWMDKHGKPVVYHYEEAE